MSAITTTMPPQNTTWIPSPLYRMSVEEYEAMVASGAFGKRRIHLINGFLVEKMTQNPPHVIAVNNSRDELDRLRPPGWHLRSSQPVRLPGQASEPEPDHCLARGANRDYLNGHPGPGDIAMLVEISDSSLADDRTMGSKVYGPAGIPIYWIVNLVDRQVEVYTGPGPGGYQSRAIFGPGQSVPLVIDGQPVGAIDVDAILP